MKLLDLGPVIVALSCIALSGCAASGISRASERTEDAWTLSEILPFHRKKIRVPVSLDRVTKVHFPVR